MKIHKVNLQAVDVVLGSFNAQTAQIKVCITLDGLMTANEAARLRREYYDNEFFIKTQANNVIGETIHLGKRR